MRLQYRDDNKSVAFRLDAAHAQEVLLIIRPAQGDKTLTRGMRKSVDGIWHGKAELPRGRHMYRFLVDNAPTLDPLSRGHVADEHGSMWSTCEVGH